MDAAAVIRAEIERRKQRVDEARHVVDDAQRALELAQAELRVAEAIGQAVRQAESESAATSTALQFAAANGDGRGRRPGVISTEWRHILGRMLARFPAGATPKQVAQIGREFGRPKLAPNKAALRMSDYLRHGFVEQDGDKFRVTGKAIEDLQLRSLDSGRLPEPASFGRRPVRG